MFVFFPCSHLTESEIKAWFHLVDTNNDLTVTSAELDTANRVFDAKCNLPDQVSIFYGSMDKSKTEFCPRYQFLSPMWVSVYDSNYLHLVQQR